ncbi:tryptophan synthase subunit alpha [Thiohalophilus thiocyanatoxydans]|uniref:Tryptophan synthase alpha chain n=1 Tax=Thiohalophilus thiocyanatoxydans TaxID=381308 RepID=A0A4R8IR52_9GAMM|nr:tryptophan synthase subunit alpha [Thiohalophilus thiocyanatoxydans]TDY00037.1 tryptophan synthase alpha chain [Thiohalophilus thiocyanatoxydans]
MSRIAGCFAAAREAGRKVLIPYITAGDPVPEQTVTLMHAMVDAGADILELGVPFSDPMAEGPVIQKAMERALTHQVTLDDVLDMVRTFRQQDDRTPVVLMGYLNPIEVKGYARFASEAAEAGIDGVLTVDLPPEEGEDYIRSLEAQDIDRIFLISPTTDEKRMATLSRASSGFVYYVSLKGVTGAANIDTKAVGDRVSTIHALTDLPVGVGFGIKDANSAAAVAAVADAVVVGSALVRQIEANMTSAEKINQAVAALLSDMRRAMDAR